MILGFAFRHKRAPPRSSPRVVVAQIGARLSYAVPAAFARSGKLERFYTDTYIGNKRWLRTLLRGIPPALRTPNIRRWLGRQSPALRYGSVTSFDIFAILYKWRLRNARDPAARFQVFAEAGRSFNRKIISRGGWRKADLVWGFCGEALEIFEAAKKNGMICVLDQNAAPHRVATRLFEEENALWAHWKPDPVPGRENPLTPREEREWSLADRIVAPSQFVMDGLEEVGAPVEKCVKIPYPVDLSRFRPVNRPPLHGRKLRVLFVGRVELPKGVQYLMEALRYFGGRGVEAQIVGQIRLREGVVNSYRDVAEFTGAIPRMEVSKYFDWADVFVFPTLCEGCAGVHLEALASGIPVVTTPHCGSVVRHGVDGEIVPIRNSEAIARALERYIDEPTFLADQQRAAESGRHRLGFETYAEQLNKLVENICVTA